MSKAIKWMLIVIGGLIGLIVIAMVSLPFLIDPNDYKDKISKMVHEKTGRELSIPGDIKLHVSPRMDVAFSLGEIHLASSKDFPDTTFASSRLAEVKLALWPLLTEKQLQVNNIVLQNVELNLIRNKEGKTNWEDLAKGADSKKAAPKEAPGEKKPSQAADKKKLAIDVGGVEIKDINMQYQDQQAGKTVSLKNFNLKVGHLQEGQPFPIQADFALSMEDAKQQPLSATVATGGDLTVFLSEQRFILDGFTLEGLFEGEVFPSSRVELALSADAEVNARQEKVLLKKLVVQQGDLTVETALSLTGFKTPTIEGTVNIPGYSPKTHMEKLGLALPPFSNPETLKHLAASLGFRLDGDQLQVSNMKLELDDTKINGEASVNNLQKPAYVLAMHIDQLDLDRYALKKADKPKKEQAETAAAKPQQQQPAGSQPLVPVHLLRGLVFTADIKIDALKAAKLNIADIVVTADGKDGLIRLQPLAANLYDGTLTVTGEIDARKDVPEMRLTKVLEGVQLGPLSVDMTGKEELSGKADIQVDVVTRGIDKPELTRNSNGKVKLSVADGQIAKLKILQTIRQAKALLDKEPIAPESATQPTGFAALTASGTLTNGVFKNDDLLAESDLMKVTGKGTVDLVQEQIDYLLTVYLTDQIQRNEETGLVNLGFDVEVRWGRYERDNDHEIYKTRKNKKTGEEELVKAKAQEVILDELQKHLDPGSDEEKKPATDAGSLINKGLKGLFGN